MTADELPPDPLAPAHPGRLFAEALTLGRVLLDGLLDALDSGGLHSLYDAVLGLRRPDLERVALALAVELMAGERLIFEPPREPVDRRPAEATPQREPSEGRRLLCEVIRPILSHGEDGVVEAIRARTNRELRRIILDPLEEARLNQLRGEREEGPR